MGEMSRAGSEGRIQAAGRGQEEPKGRRSGRIRRFLWWSFLGLGTTASGLGLWVLRDVLERSPLFVVKQVDVEASGRLGPDAIRSMSGIRDGSNLLSLDAAGVSRRLEAYPWIRNATVVKRFPDRVWIRIVERKPAVLVDIKGRLFYMDEEGRILDGVRPGGPFDFPTLTGLEETLEESGRCAEGREVQQALSLLSAFKAAPDLGRVSEIHVDRSQGLIFLLEGFAVPVRVGWSGFPTKLARFEKVLPLLVSQSKSVERVDLRFSGQIVVRQGEDVGPEVPRRDRIKTLAGSAPSFHQTT